MNENRTVFVKYSALFTVIKKMSSIIHFLLQSAILFAFCLKPIILNIVHPVNNVDLFTGPSLYIADFCSIYGGLFRSTHIP